MLGRGREGQSGRILDRARAARRFSGRGINLFNGLRPKSRALLKPEAGMIAVELAHDPVSHNSVTAPSFPILDARAAGVTGGIIRKRRGCHQFVARGRKISTLSGQQRASSEEWPDPQSPPGQAESAPMRSISAKNSMKSPGLTGLAFMK